MSKLVGKIKRTTSFHSTRSSCSRGNADLQIDAPSPATRALSGLSSAEKNILLEEKHLKLRDKIEKDIYKQLKTRMFILTPAYNLALLRATGMNIEFDIIFKAVGWENV